MALRLAFMPGSVACWAFLHQSVPPGELKRLAQKNQGAVGVDATRDWDKLTLVTGTVNLLPEDQPFGSGE